MKQTEEIMAGLGGAIHEALAETIGRKAFVLLVFETAAPGTANYISNANRADVVAALRQVADRVESFDAATLPEHPTLQ